MSKYSSFVSAKKTPQTQPIFGKKMVKGDDVGYVFEVDDFIRLERFLVIGSDKGTFYAGPKKLTLENAQCIVKCLEKDPIRTIDTIVAISQSGRAPKNDQAIFALAVAASDKNLTTRKLALAALPKVCRIGTHLFSFVEDLNNIGLRGWGRGLRTGIGNWYKSKDVNSLAYQITKYQQRNGWSHRDLLRLSHPKPSDDQASIFRYIVGKTEKDEFGNLPELVQAVEEAKKADTKGVIKLIQDHNLVREHIPTHHLNDVNVWAALLEKMPLGALVRNLGKMTNIGLLKPLSEATKIASEKLENPEAVRKSRLHPLGILEALKTYSNNRGLRGKLTWSSVPRIKDALDNAFYLAFDNVEPSNKRTLVAVDISGSMGFPGYDWMGSISGSSLKARDVAAAMSMAVVRSEPNYHVVGFSRKLVDLGISSKDSLNRVLEIMHRTPMGTTDCALPMLYALEKNLEVDTFIIYTDNATNQNSIHPSQALREYRKNTGIPAKLVVAAVTATKFSIADPDDIGMLDLCGFDSSVPSIIADFSRTEFNVKA